MCEYLEPWKSLLITGAANVGDSPLRKLNETGENC